MFDSGAFTYREIESCVRLVKMSKDQERPHVEGLQGPRLRISIRGAVQGVGFRPFVFRLATELGLQGWVNNSPQGVLIEVEGGQSELENFLLLLERGKPPRSFIQSLETSWLDAVGYHGFEIRASDATGARTALVLPDIATCPDCLREIFDATNRRYLYPFTNCTNCGPRFSIIESLPYDRVGTSMKRFTMCPECRAEYEDPRDRRFHAQPNACPICGPHLEFWNADGQVVPGQPSQGGRDDDVAALEAASKAIRGGKIVAVKGLGGFHMMVAADNDKAVGRLRELKHREEKPFALMFPSLESIQSICEVSSLEERLLRSPEAPIVLLRRLQTPWSKAQEAPATVSGSIAPANPNLGVMLPYTPLHHLLLSRLGFPVVATSGNLSDEPICIDENEAVERLKGIADHFLVHNRPIVRHVDDSIVRVMGGRELVLRRGRGYAPLPIEVRSVGNPAPAGRGDECGARNVLAVGAHLKNTVALSVGPQVFISQHIGDLETDQAYEAFQRVIIDLQRLYEASPGVVVADAHPDYLSSKFARDFAGQAFTATSASGVPVDRPARPRLLTIQHHVAHILSCMAENELEPPVLGVSWDGTGYGLDGTVWGGEFFLVTDVDWQRLAHVRQFRLLGGDKAIKEPRRTALGLLFELYGRQALTMAELPSIRAFSPGELPNLEKMLARGVNSPLTSSAGRLFDAVASLMGLRQEVHFEGQAAMELEFAMDGTGTNEAYVMPIAPESNSNCEQTTPVHQPDSAPKHDPPHITHYVLDWSSMIAGFLDDLRHKISRAQISAKFHNALAEGIVASARLAGQQRVVLSGGCFQNRYLTERAIQRLRDEGFRPYWHQRVPPNDGGIALGQILAAMRSTHAQRKRAPMPFES